MQAAWAQLGEVEKANRAIALAQLAELVASRLHARLTSLETTRLVQVAALAPRVPLEAGTTLAAQVAASATPVVALSSAFRRAVRPTGPMLWHARRRRHACGSARSSAAARRCATSRAPTRTRRDRCAQLGVDRDAGCRDGRSRARRRGVEGDGRPRPRVAGGRAGIGAVLADPSAWQAPRADFDPAASVATRWSESVLREATLPAVADIRQERVAPLVAELATAAATRALPTHDLLVTRAQTLNNDLISRWGAGVGPVIGGGRDPGRVNPGHVDPGRIEPDASTPAASTWAGSSSRAAASTRAGSTPRASGAARGASTPAASTWPASNPVTSTPVASTPVASRSGIVRAARSAATSRPRGRAAAAPAGIEGGALQMVAARRRLAHRGDRGGDARAAHRGAEESSRASRPCPSRPRWRA